MFKKAVIAVPAIICVLVASSYFSPHWTVYRMRHAIESRDYKAFSSYVDFPAVRESFKRQIVATPDAQKEGRSNAPNAFEALAGGIVASLINPVIDILVTPASLIEMMNSGTPTVSQAVVTSAITRVPTAPETLPEMDIAYRNWDTVTFQRHVAAENEGRFILVRQGLWSWKLAQVELPS